MENRKLWEMLADNIRCIVSVPSNCEKTKAMFKIRSKSICLKFENNNVFLKSLYELKYIIFETVLLKFP